jgi:hypothetical protein
VSDTPLRDAIDELGASGEGFDATVRAGSDRAPEVSAGGWFDFGKADRFGAGAAVQKTRDAWAAIAKVVWRPGRK